MYQFYPHAEVPTATFLVASFALLLLENQGVETSVRIRCGPTRVTPTSQRNSTSLPKVFDLSPSNQLLCLDIRITTTQSVGTLYVPSSLLLDSIAKRQQLQLRQSDSIIVPWTDWAEGTSWVDTGSLDGHHEYFVFGQRMAGLILTTGSQGQDVLMFDFDQNRLKSRHMLSVEICGI